MVPTETGPSPWAAVLIAGVGSLLGGFGATLLWWLATLAAEARRLRQATTQKRNAVALEIAKLHAWLRLIKEDRGRASSSVSARGTGALGALIRLGPDLTPGRSLEPQLGELEHRLGMVDAAVMRLFASTTGIAGAMRGNEEEIEDMQRTLLAEADAARVALKDFEQAMLSGSA